MKTIGSHFCGFYYCGTFNGASVPPDGGGGVRWAERGGRSFCNGFVGWCSHRRVSRRAGEDQGKVRSMPPGASAGVQKGAGDGRTDYEKETTGGGSK